MSAFFGLSKEQESFQKNIYLYFIDYVKDFSVWMTTNGGKFFK